MRSYSLSCKCAAIAFGTVISFSSHSALINIYQASDNITSIMQAESIIAAATAPDTSFFSETFDFVNNFPGHTIRFALESTGLFDTSTYSAFRLEHDDGFKINVGSTTAEFDGNTARRFSDWFPVVDAGIQNFDLTYWENTGGETLRIEGMLRIGGSITLASIGNPIMDNPDPNGGNGGNGGSNGDNGDQNGGNGDQNGDNGDQNGGGPGHPTVSVPEPSSIALLSMGLAGIAAIRKTRTRRTARS